jgi:aspartate aminotransferase-like enzyme
MVRDAMRATEAFGFELARERQWELGRQVRALTGERGFPSVAASGFEAPGVVVSYTSDPEIQSAKKFVALGFQLAAGVPLQCDEPADFRSFRIGLFGLDKLADIDRTVARLSDAFDRIA